MLNHQVLPIDPGAEAINNDNEMRELFQFIPRNKAITSQLEQIKPTDEALTALSLAIRLGDPSATIFSNNKCHIFLLHLLKNNLENYPIPFWEGMTVYMYLLALQQFTDLQALKAEDQHFKSIRPVRVHSLHQKTNKNDIGNIYPRIIYNQIQEDLGITIDIEKFRHFISTLSATNAWLIEIQDPLIDMQAAEAETEDEDYHSADYLNTRLVANIPFFVKIRRPGKTDSYLYPSFAVIQYCLDQLSPQPMRMMPIFGSVDIDTLYELHKNNIHPIPLYSTLVRDNLGFVHASKSGSFFNAMHDIGHTFWASMLTFEERQILFNDIIPLLKQAKHHNQNEAIEKLNDFNLTPVRQYRDAKRRFKLYLTKSISSSLLAESAFNLDKFSLFNTAPTKQPEPAPTPQKSTCTLI